MILELGPNATLTCKLKAENILPEIGGHFGTAKGLLTWREGALTNRATRGGLTSHTFLSKTYRIVKWTSKSAGKTISKS